MLLPLLSFLVISPRFTAIRDDYGIPKISAETEKDAFFGQGYTTAQDRLWQMETSRRSSEGKLSEIFGPKTLKSDQEVIEYGPTSESIQSELNTLPKEQADAFTAYAEGVNAYIQDAENHLNGATLPPEYSTLGFKPSPWTTYDSAAITVHLLQLFGRGGDGEIRDWALLQYLQTRPALKSKYLDVFDDIGWINDPKAPTTVQDYDDLSSLPHPKFQNPTRAETVAQLKALPKISLFELLPALQIAQFHSSKLVAQSLGAPFQTGSYCIAVGKYGSANETPILLSGPQMGHSNPSVVHETALRAPYFSLTGIDVPGMPGIVIGSNGKITWGLTSGVADTEDIFEFPTTSESNFEFGKASLPISDQTSTIVVKGGSPATVHSFQTKFGTVILNSKTSHSILVRRDAYSDKELASLTGLFGLYHADTASDADVAGTMVTMSFNLFFVDTAGNVGWRYCGFVPIRNLSLDPRLPTPGIPSNDWRGFIAPDKMPHTFNPKFGSVCDWNGKPTSWWFNGDTPVWGEIYHTSMIQSMTHSDGLTPAILELIPSDIASNSSTFDLFNKLIDINKSPGWYKSYLGMDFNGSYSADGWQKFLFALRKELFMDRIGNFLGTGFFDLVLQPSMMLHALQHKTKFDYLEGHTPSYFINKAFADVKNLKRFVAPSFSVPGEESIPYSDRGTYIQIAEIGPDGKWTMRSVLPPGESESGDHSLDQVNLARGWLYKQTWLGK